MIVVSDMVDVILPLPEDLLGMYALYLLNLDAYLTK